MTDSMPTPELHADRLRIDHPEPSGVLLPEVPGAGRILLSGGDDPGKPPSVLLYAPSACDESLPSPRVATALVPGTRSANREFSRFVVTEIKSLGAGGRCDSASVSLQPPEEIEGPAIPRQAANWCAWHRSKSAR